MSSDEDKIAKIRGFLERLKKMLECHRGANHVAGVSAAIRYLSDYEISPYERMHGARSIFKTMIGGMGTLGDFVIWDEDETKRVALNHELSEIIANLWDALEC